MWDDCRVGASVRGGMFSAAKVASANRHKYFSLMRLESVARKKLARGAVPVHTLLSQVENQEVCSRSSKLRKVPSWVNVSRKVHQQTPRKITTCSQARWRGG